MIEASTSGMPNMIEKVSARTSFQEISMVTGFVGQTQLE